MCPPLYLLINKLHMIIRHLFVSKYFCTVLQRYVLLHLLKSSETKFGVTSSPLALSVHGRMKYSRTPLIRTLVIRIDNYPVYKVRIFLYAADKETNSQA